MKTSKNEIIRILSMNDNDLDRAVKIRDTKFDRKRKYTEDEYLAAEKFLKKGESYKEVEKRLGISSKMLKYHFDEEYRNTYNMWRDGKHYGKTHLNKANRVQYKRSLVASGVLA